MRSRISCVLLTLTVSACSGGGYGGPTDPDDDGFNVAGTWMVTATVIETTCEGVNLDDEATEEVLIEHTGNQITFIVAGIGSVTGIINNETGDFEIDADIFIPGTGSLTLHESGRFTSETRYTSQETVTVEDAEASCHFRTTDEGTRLST